MLWVLINLQLSVGKEATPGDLDLVLEFKKGSGVSTTTHTTREKYFFNSQTKAKKPVLAPLPADTERNTSTFTNSIPTLILSPHVIPHSAKSLILISYHKSTPVGAPIREIAAPHNVFYREWFCLTLTLILYNNRFLFRSIVIENVVY